MPTKNRPSHPISLRDETREYLSTAEAAFHLGRKPRTLIYWNCRGVGLVTPVRLGSRLGWPVSELRRVLGVEVSA